MRSLLFSILLFATFFADQASAFNFKNFHEIAKGEFYRSGQLSDEVLKEKIKKYGIRSVVNLRGASSGKEWYDAELGVTQELGVQYQSIRMSAKRLPHRADLIALMDAFKTLPRPILVHCQAGADRAGEASAIYGMEYLGWSRKKALKMLSPRYLHFPVFVPAKAYFIKKVYQGEAWVREQYDPCDQDYKYYDKTMYCPSQIAAM